MTGSGRAAIALALNGIRPDSDVWITSSLGTPLRRLSPCVPEAVGRCALPTEAPSGRTAAVVIVHEWGFPHPDRPRILTVARQRGWRVLDDCAHAFAHGLALARAGATVALSLPKFFPVPRGGLLARGPGADGQELAALSQPSSGHDGDAIADWQSGWSIEPPTADPEPMGNRQLDEWQVVPMLRLVGERSAAHVTNWQRLRAITQRFGLTAHDDLPSGVIPQVFRLRTSRQFALARRLADAGVETSPPFYVGWLALPCHADLPDSYFATVERALAAHG